MQGWDQVGHCNVCKPMTKWDTLMCDPPIPYFPLARSSVPFHTLVYLVNRNFTAKNKLYEGHRGRKVLRKFITPFKIFEIIISGRKLYQDACKLYSVIPVSYFFRFMEAEKFDIDHRQAGLQNGI